MAKFRVDQTNSVFFINIPTVIYKLIKQKNKKQILDCLVNGKNMVTEFYYIFFIEIYYMYCYKSGNSPTMFGSCLVVSHSLPIKMVIMVK